MLYESHYERVVLRKNSVFPTPRDLSSVGGYDTGPQCFIVLHPSAAVRLQTANLTM